MDELLYQAIADLPGTVAYSDYLMVRCPFHGGDKPNMMISQRRDRAWCMGEAKSYDLQQTYSALLMQPAPEAVEGPEYPDKLVPVRRGSWVSVELERRHISDWSRLAMSTSGDVLAFLSPSGEPEVLRFEGFGYRTVGNSPLWTQQDESRNAFLGTVIVYGMLDAAVIAPACVGLGLLAVTPTRGQTRDPRPFLTLPAPIWVWPDQHEETNALWLLSKLGWRAGGLIEPVVGMKDPSEVSVHYGLDWLWTYIASYTLSSWRHLEQTETPALQLTGSHMVAGQ